MGEIPRRRFLTFAASASLASCSTVLEAMVSIYIPREALTQFDARLLQFSKDEGLPFDHDTPDHYDLSGRGMSIEIRSFSTSTAEPIQFTAFFQRELFFSASSRYLDGVADRLLDAMRGIDGVTAVKEHA